MAPELTVTVTPELIVMGPALIQLYVVSIVAGGLWGWYLHNTNQLIGDYPYDDAM